MVRYAEVAQHLFEELELLVVNLTATALPALRQGPQPIEYEKKVDVQGEEAEDAIENVLLDAPERLGGCWTDTSSVGTI